MKYNGIISKKIEKLYEELNLIRDQGKFTTSKLNDDLLFKHAIERSLQICVEIIIDISNRVISIEGQSPATNASSAIQRLEQLGIIKNADEYTKMVQFRNIVVHRYEKIDNSILVDICHHNLTDFEKFIKEIEKV